MVSGRPTPLLVVLLAAAGTLFALAVLVWLAWTDSDRLVVLDLPAAPAPIAAGSEDEEPVDRPSIEAEAVDADPTEGDAEADAEPAVEVGDPAFFEMPMQVVRRSNIRAQPTPSSAALGVAEEGTMVILVEAKPTRGYYRIATGEIEGWIWGANLVAADPTQQPDAPEAAAPAP